MGLGAAAEVHSLWNKSPSGGEQTRDWGKAKSQEGPALAWAVYISPGSQAQLHREGWLAAHLLSPGMIGSAGILLLSLLELG